MKDILNHKVREKEGYGACQCEFCLPEAQGRRNTKQRRAARRNMRQSIKKIDYEDEE